MSERLAQRIRDRRAKELHDLRNFWFGDPKPPKAPAEQSSPDCPLIPEEPAGAPIKDAWS